MNAESISLGYLFRMCGIARGFVLTIPVLMTFQMGRLNLFYLCAKNGRKKPPERCPAACVHARAIAGDSRQTPSLGRFPGRAEVVKLATWQLARDEVVE